jgi:hypothetical protein
MVLENIGTLNGIGSEGFAQNTFLPPFPCNPSATFVPAPLVSVDGSVVLPYGMFVPQKGPLGYKGL